MKIGIIGYGFVGKAVHSVIYPRNQVFTVDPKQDNESNYTVDDLIQDNPDIIFICVPTPTTNAKCDDSLVMHYVEKLKDFPGLVAVKSTVPISTVEKISTIRSTTVIWPEFLREAHAEHDAWMPDYIAIGAPSDTQFQYVVNFIKNETKIIHGHGIQTKIHRLTPKGASAFKYAVNSFLATKVVFFHQMKRWLDSRGDPSVYDEITTMMEVEPRIGGSHMIAPGEHGFGYAGSCFPKDVEALLDQVYHKDRTTFPLLNEVDVQNHLLRKTNDPPFVRST